MTVAALSYGCDARSASQSGFATTLTVGMEAAPGSLDPRLAADAGASRICALLHCSLVEPDAEGGYSPSLAASWQREADGSWLFRLRSDVLFHDGRPVTANDVVATYRSVLESTVASPKRAALAAVKSIEAQGPDLVRFTLSEENPTLLDAATLGILPAEQTVGALDANTQTGCGPYRIARQGRDGEVQLTAFERWFGGRPTLAAITFRVVPDATMRVLELRSGSLDLVENALEPDAVAYLAEHEPRVHVVTGPYDAVQYLGFNHRHPILRDLRVRRAIAYAIDREAIVANLLRGQAVIASGMLPPHHWAFDGNLRRYGYDPARARRLLDRAGFIDPDADGPQVRFHLRYKTSTVELRRRIAEVFAAQLADVGIAIDIESNEWGTFFADIRRGDFDLYSLAWIGIRDPDLMRVAFDSRMVPPAGANRGFYADARVDEVSERARRTPDVHRRKQLYARLQRRSAARLPYVFLWWPRNVTVLSRRVEGFTPAASGDLTGLAFAHLNAEP